MEDVYDLVSVSVYKEPLRKVEGGYGYYGVLLGTGDGEKVQCHECGVLYSSLTFHVYKAHGLRVREYKEKYGLAYKTALVSENLRNCYKEKTLEWLETLTPEEKRLYREQSRLGREKRCVFQPKLTLETKNKRGTCPDQLLAKIKEVAAALGKTPTKSEFIWETGTQRYVHLIYKTFGSWSEAVRRAGYEVREKHKGVRVRHTTEELLDYLRLFKRVNGRVPTATDFRRDYLPDYEVYIRRFGSIHEARLLAGIENG